MNDATYEFQKARFVAIHDVWQNALGLRSWWSAKLRFYRGPIPHATGPQVIATCNPEWKYKQYVIHVNLEQVQGSDDVELENVVIHELSHVLLSGLDDADTLEVDGAGFRMIEERTVTDLAQAFMWVRDLKPTPTMPKEDDADLLPSLPQRRRPSRVARIVSSVVQDLRRLPVHAGV